MSRSTRLVVVSQAAGTAEQTQRASSACARLRRGPARLWARRGLHVVLRDAADFAAINEAYASFFPADRRPAPRSLRRRRTVAALVAIAAPVIRDDEPRDIVHPAGGTLASSGQLRGPQRDTLWLSAWSRGADRTASIDGDVAADRVDSITPRLLPPPGSGRRRRRGARLHRRARHFAAMNDVYREVFAGHAAAGAGGPSSPA